MDFHNRKQRAEHAVERFHESDAVPQRSKELVDDFWKHHVEHHEKRDLNPLTKEKYYKAYRQIYSSQKHPEGFLDVKLDELTPEDVTDFITNIKESDYADSTILYNFLRPLKKFYRRFKHDHADIVAENDELRRAIDKLLDYTLKTGRDEGVTEDDYLKKHEVKDLLDACHNPRDQAFIMMLSETGLRVGAALNIKMKDLDRQSWEHGYIIEIREAKTKASEGTRYVRRAIPYINEWLENHPNPENGESFFFTKLEEDEPLGYRSAKYIPKRAADRAELDKEVTPHTFRRTAATWLYEEGFDELEIKDTIGWSRNSDVPILNYIAKQKNQKDTAERRYDLVDVEDQDEDELENQVCEVCEEVNPPSNSHCVNCQRPLTLKEAMSERDETMAGLIEEIDQNSEAAEALTKAVLKQLTESETDTLKGLINSD